MFPSPKHFGEKPDYLIVGLGNPGERYENTRQNIGFDAVDFLIKNCAVIKTNNVRSRKKQWAFIYKGLLEGHVVFYIKPQMFMDNSGMSVDYVLNEYRMSPKRLIVIHDDINLKIGSIKAERGANNCGHRGVESIIEHIDVSELLRVRIGVGDKPDDMADNSYLLSRFSDEERQILNSVFPVLREFFTYYFFYGFDEAMKVLENHNDALEC